MVLTTLQGGTFIGTQIPYLPADVNYGAGVNRVRMAQMQAGMSAGVANYGAYASRAAGMQQTTPGVYGASGPYVAGVAGLAGWDAPVAAGLANFGLPRFVGGGASIGMNQGLAAERLTGVTRDLGSTANAGYRGMNVQNPSATIAGLAAQVGSPTQWAALTPAMEAANAGASAGANALR